MSKSTKIISSIALVGCSVLAAVSLFELVLRLLGFPSENVGIYTHPPNFLEQRSNIEFSYTFRTNSQGLRYKEIPLEKPVGTTRVLVLGDSFVEGFGVRADQTFSEVVLHRWTVWQPS